MIASLDNNKYDEKELVQIKLPLNIPYLADNKSYERCNGEVEYNGIEYNYVKRMVYNDTLYLYCIPNQQKTKISNTKNLYAKQNADNSTNKKSEQSLLQQINFLFAFNENAQLFNFDVNGTSSSHTITFNNCTILKGFTTNHLQPPDLSI